jgi:ABC-type phosphate transport system substrate-binding protein
MAAWTYRIALALAIVAMVSIPAPAEPARFVLIRSAKNPTTHMSSEMVKAIYSGRTTTWPSGDTLVAVIGAEDSATMAWLAETLFNVSAKTLLIRIKQQVFRGEMPRPIIADDDAATIAAVQSKPGVLGFVTTATALPRDVATIAIE